MSLGRCVASCCCRSFGRLGTCLCSCTKAGRLRRYGFTPLILTGVFIILSLCANLASFSVIPAIATHAAFNTVADFLNGLFVNVQPTARIPFELVMTLCGLAARSEEHTSELQSLTNLVCRLLLEKKNK